jgi:Protein of unknown function (DUF2934)
MHGPLPADDHIVLDNNGWQSPDHDIAVLAYHLWMKRGCPIGSPDDDWFRAEADLKNHLKVQAAAG